MPLDFARRLTGRVRSRDANLQLGVVLAFVAGAINAGGFLAVRQYTSHMTGIVSSMADNLVQGASHAVIAGGGALLSFLVGAMASAMLVNFARRRQWAGEYAVPLLVEALLLLAFGLAGPQLQVAGGLFIPATVMLLCFMMGLQNALISKISRSEIRTTHITGIVTDIGIELGKLAYWNRDHERGSPVAADRARLTGLSLLATSFFAGGVAGAFGFQHAGFFSTVPLAIVLTALAVVPALDDLTRWARAR